MKNWYRQALKKSASITFAPADSYKIAQPMLVDDIGYDILNFIYRKKILNTKPVYHHISGDGESQWWLLGILNFYEDQTSGLTPQKVQEIVKAYNQEKQGVIALKIVGHDVSQSRGVPTTRVQVVENKTDQYERVPELNISNVHAYQFLRFLQDLGLPVDPKEMSGSISVEALQYAITEPNPDMAVYQNEMSSGDADVSSGISMIVERYPRYVEILQKMIDYINKHQLPNRRIVFG